jgi:hypothetical protein
MTAPNLLTPTTITGLTATADLSSTSSTSLVSNAASSGKVLKIVSLYVANVSGSAATIGLRYHSAAAGGGTATDIVYGVTVPAAATEVLLDKDAPIYLPENSSLTLVAGTADALKVVASYEDIS